ncbi:pathogen-associated molecular patterns-induced protein A70-like [Andrographis paniculata]|uniref:pathogen-associated molecular patterns-induced protein A70-like n=1 Tax=Andrographis paniculata TaxID=175694 RepID=UPI0021E7DE2D|nr:pathogen-associated molecular patterns-induced protein A70-like [Andrographis paniculata]
MMFEESAIAAAAASSSSLWGSITSWFTPTVLFLLLNLMIAAIALISHTHTHTQLHPPQDHLKIARSPSILQRLKSINFYRSHPQDPPPTFLSPPSQPNPNPNQNKNLPTHLFGGSADDDDSQATPLPEADSYIHEQDHFDFDPKDSILDGENDNQELQSMDEIYSRLSKGTHFGRTKSDTEPASGANRVQNTARNRMRKSVSMKAAAAFEETASAVEARRPATARERVLAKVTDCDEEVDAKADHFIEKFKQQLKLQRLDSILRYKDKIRRGFGGR